MEGVTDPTMDLDEGDAAPRDRIAASAEEAMLWLALRAIRGKAARTLRGAHGMTGQQVEQAVQAIIDAAHAKADGTLGKMVCLLIVSLAFIGETADEMDAAAAE